MGASGAGKTTLLDVLASRVTMGVVTGQMLVDGRQRDSGFQRKTGYVQQQDLHLSTSTVREALSFSALLRQPRTTPKKEKLDYVDEVIRVLEMVSFFRSCFAPISPDLELRDMIQDADSEIRHRSHMQMPSLGFLGKDSMSSSESVSPSELNLPLSPPFYSFWMSQPQA